MDRLGNPCPGGGLGDGAGMSAGSSTRLDLEKVSVRVALAASWLHVGLMDGQRLPTISLVTQPLVTPYSLNAMCPHPPH